MKLGLSVFLLLTLWAFAPAAATMAPGTSTAQNPRASFATPGAKQVALTACNAGGCTTVTKTVTVLNPLPVIDLSAVGGTIFTAGQLVNLSAAAHGRPPLTYSWKILSSDLEFDLAGGGAWWDTATAPPGLYVVTLAVSNADGDATSLPVAVTVAADAGAGFYTLAPCRVLDTRTGTALSGTTPLSISIAGAAGCGVPSTARAIAANITVVSPTAAGSVALYPGNYPQPPVSTVNFAAGQTRANNAIIALASDSTGKIAAKASLAGSIGTVQLIVDVDGYFQ